MSVCWPRYARPGGRNGPRLPDRTARPPSRRRRQHRTWPDLTRQARQNLDRQAIRNVEVISGDGSRGVPEHAPYDAIIVSAAFPRVPEPLASQLRTGGRLVQPIGPGGHEDVVLFRRTAAGLEPQKTLIPASFVRLRGEFGFPA